MLATQNESSSQAVMPYRAMSLSRALGRNRDTMTTTHQQYMQDVAYVTTFCSSVLASKLPALNDPPPDWSSFQAAYTQANTDALGWANNVLFRLIGVPGEVDSFHAGVVNSLDLSIQLAGQLTSHPDSRSARELLLAHLSTLGPTVGMVASMIEQSVNAISNFQNTIPDLATQLTTIAQQSIADSNADQQQIDQLNQDIANLNQQIRNYYIEIGALSGVAVLSFTIGTVATIVLWPVGAATWFVMGPAIILAGSVIALDATKIVAAKNQIEADTDQITGLTADVATLSVLAQQYSGFADQTAEVQSSLAAIAAAWSSLEDDVNDAVAEIADGMNDFNADDWAAVESDLQQALDAWNDAYNAAQTLTLELEGSDAQLSFGMSQEQVQAAVDAGTSVNVIEYLNAL